MTKRRFEYRKGSSSKFWEIEVAGSRHTVRYGRIGTDGQTKSKEHDSPTTARDAAADLIAAKVKKGYAEIAGAKKATTKKATKKAAKKAVTKATPAASKKASKKAAPARAGSATLVRAVSGGYPKGSFVGLWEDGKALWVLGCDSKSKPEDVSLRDIVDADGFVQRWRFSSPKEAKAAAAAIKAQKKLKPADVPDWAQIDAAQLEPLMRAKDLPMIARYEVSNAGPLTLTRATPFDWVHPRPASRCACGRALMPTYQLSGAVDARLGKKIRLYVSFCPGSLQTPYCEGTIEVLVQHEGSKPSGVVAYGLGPGSYYVVARSVLWSPIGSSFSWAVTTHFGEKGSPGTVQTQTFRKRKDADACFKKQAPSKPVEPSKLGKWYRELLAERAHFHRVPGAEPLVLKLRPMIAPTLVSGSPYARSHELFDTTDTVGGQPNFTQSDWSDKLGCPECENPMLFVFQTGSGAPWWCEQLNDGDAGSFQFFACPRCKSPHGRALFECH